MINSSAGEQKTHGIFSKQEKITQDQNPFILNFHTLQDYSTKDDQLVGRRYLIGQFNAKDLISIPNSSNVRNYLRESKKGKNLVSSGVHSMIYDTLVNNPENFVLLNGGITIVTETLQRNNDKKQISLRNCSIINGAQTKGVLKTFYENYPDVKVNVKVEIIVALPNFEENEDLANEISIARNQQTAVKAISIAGRRGLLDKLEAICEVPIKTSESDKGKFDTLKLIQLLFALMPENIWKIANPRTSFNKAVVYSSKSKWLNKFKDISKEEDKYSEVSRYIYDVADDLLKLYLNIKTNKYNITKFLKDKHGNPLGYKITPQKTVEIQDGVIFPIIALLSSMVKEENGKFVCPNPTDDEVKSIVYIIWKLSGIVDHQNVQTLGKNLTTYDSPMSFIPLLGDKLECFYKTDIK